MKFLPEVNFLHNVHDDAIAYPLETSGRRHPAVDRPGVTQNDVVDAATREALLSDPSVLGAGLKVERKGGRMCFRVQWTS